MDIHRNLNLLAKTFEHRNQALDGKTIEFRAPHSRKITVIDASDLLGFTGAQVALIQNLEHLSREHRLELTRLSVWPAQISE